MVNKERSLAAFYAGATQRYQHGVLGDSFEGSVLKARPFPILSRGEW